ncbi:MAG TPA: hypothetical protein VGR91_19870 [Stellaceae bacterium]|nr:hypothetical protein [Stellaceae bacterium]
MPKFAILIPLLLLAACGWAPTGPMPHTACLAASAPATALPQVCNPAIHS